MATRERAGQLARALDSLLAQDHPDFEIVVVDNA
ncbi:glycosyltransferase family 2 protein, partial [Streptomyces sp. GC420]